MKIFKIASAAIFLYNSLYGSTTVDMIDMCPGVRDSTLIVGSSRCPGGISSEPIALIVGQRNADFSHTSSFTDSQIISINVGPSESAQPHIQGDWFELPFTPNSQRRIMFEWFPSCTPNRTTHLLPAIHKAFDTLAPGGELIIDHMPFVNIFSDRFTESFLEVEKPIPSDMGEILKNEKRRDNYLFAQLWQQYDPFSMSRDYRERVDIFNILCSQQRLLLNAPPSVPNILDKQTNFAAVQDSMQYMSSIFGTSYAQVLSDLISEMKEEIPDKGLYDMFEWTYYMLSRGSGIINALTSLGFEVKDNSISYHEINPYNKRRHAWIIKAYKPHNLSLENDNG